MSKIFISYRRDESATFTGRICDRLIPRYGAENVFKDVYSIPPGVDFRKYLAEAVGRCEVMLVVIGRGWLTSLDATGTRRLDDERDFVRIEIESALQRDSLVIPVLIQGAVMPRADQLPASLRELAFRNAVSVGDDPHFHRDMDALIAELDRRIQPVTPPATRASAEPVRIGEAIQSLFRLPVPDPKTVARGFMGALGSMLSQVATPVELTVAHIPAGSFTMGSPVTELERLPCEGPQVQVTITRPFGMGVSPVTVGQFRAFVEATGYRTEAEATANGSHRWEAGRSRWVLDPDCTWRQPGWTQTDGFPVVCVSWNDANAFCEWVSRELGRPYRLPTEAEWEYACRAGTATPFAFGTSLSATQANFDGNYPYGGGAKGPSLGRASPVGTYPPNAWGLQDMHGNVWEWCLDRFEENYYRLGPSVDPKGPTTGTHRVLRGGSWFNTAAFCRSAYRTRNAPNFRAIYTGFRVVCTDLTE